MESPFQLSRTQNFVGRDHLGTTKQIVTTTGPKQQRYIHPPNTTVFFQGQPGDSAFFIKSGKVAIVKRGDVPGEYNVIATLKPGEIFGEMALIDGRPRSASAVCVQQTELLEINSIQFAAAIGEMEAGLARRISALTTFAREIPHRSLWQGGQPPAAINEHLASISPLLSTENGVDISLSDGFLRGLYGKLIGYAKDRLPDTKEAEYAVARP